MNTQNVLRQFTESGDQVKFLLDGGQGIRCGSRLGVCGVEARASPEPYSWNGMHRGRSEYGIFQYTLKGEGRLQVNGADLRLPAGRAMLLPIPHAHVYSLPEGGEWTFLFLTILGEDIMPYWKGCCRRAQYVMELPSSAPVLQTAVRLIQDVLNRYEEFNAEVAGRTYGFVMDMCHHLDRVQVHPGRPESPGLVQAREFAMENFRQPIGVEEMAEAAGMSRSHFSRTFSQMEGMSPGRFLIRLRMKEAEKLLVESDIPISDVAAQAGFSDLNYFCRAFRNFHGVTPGTYRASGLFTS